ncbi:MAG: flagellar protein FlaG [Lachnospiraceae bacterium]|nr:flagellar protein FlaG [Lachnospiraceae bacterium]
MTMQAQPLQQNVTQKTEPVSTDANPTETQANNIDPTTVSVAAATDASENNSENTSSGQRDSGGYNYAENAKQQNDRIKKAVEQLNKNLSHSSAIFGIHEATNRVTIKIVDKDTKEVIKELPPEKTLDMIAKVWEIAGILVDEKR